MDDKEKQYDKICESGNNHEFENIDIQPKILDILAKNLNYKQHEKDIQEYINKLPEKDMKLITKFLYTDSKVLVNKLLNDDDTIKEFFDFTQFLFAQNEIYGDKNYVAMIEKSIFDQIENSEDMTPEDLEFVKNIFNNNLQFFNHFFPEKTFMNPDFSVWKEDIRNALSNRNLTPFNISQIQKILKGEAFSFPSGTGKIWVESTQMIGQKEKGIMKYFLRKKNSSSVVNDELAKMLGKKDRESIQQLLEKNEGKHMYCLHVTPGVAIQKDGKNILGNLKKLHELIPDIIPYILLDSWLLDTNYEKFCEKHKKVLKQQLMEECHRNDDMKKIIDNMENNKADTDKLEKLGLKLKDKFETYIKMVEIDTTGDMEDSENTISKRLNSIKDSIVTSSTYKLKDTEKFKNESTYEKEKYNITKNNTAEARQHAKENLKNGNINGLVTWIINLVIQEYLLKKYDENFGLGHGRVIVSLD